MNKLSLFVLATLAFVILAACAPGSTVEVNTPPSVAIQLSMPGTNPLANQPDTSGRVARFGAGLWHGLIAPISLFISFFNSDMHIYEVHNAGSEYDFGFMLGVGLIFLLLGFFIRLRR
ncbi:MAG: hypothetical protein ABI904_21605 [Chloroflexota bacterium]